MMFAGGLQTMQHTVTPVSKVEAVTIKNDDTNKILAEYIWLGSTGADLRSRTVCLDASELGEGYTPEDLPIAEIDGSSYGSPAEEECCGIYLQPKKIFPDPFRGGSHVLVLCDTYVPPLTSASDVWDNMQPHISNHRAACEEVMQQAAKQQPVFTMHQEYTLLSEGCPESGGGFVMGPAPGVPIKNAAGTMDKATAATGRKVSELHMHACLAAGLSFSGSFGSSTHQYSYKIGPCLGVDMADQLSMSRFLLHRIAGYSDAGIHYDMLGCSKLASGNKCTVQFSTASSRDPHYGLSAIQDMMERLHVNQSFDNCSEAHSAMSGSSGSWHSSNGFDEPVSSHGNGRFTVGLGNRHASIMVPTSTLLNKCGPILDRRPPAGSDPYLTTMLLVSSACAVPLPQNTLKAMQLAASLAAAACNGTAMHSGGVPIPSSQRPTLSCASFSSFGSDSMASVAPTCSLSSLYDSADSEDVLLSALDKIDGYSSATSPILMGSYMFGEDEDDACSELCSDACSPPLAVNSLADAVEADEAMYFE